jgi:hypothetical protein
MEWSTLSPGNILGKEARRILPDIPQSFQGNIGMSD